MFHRPHPGNIIRMYVLRSIVADLEDAGLISGNEEKQDKK